MGRGQREVQEAVGEEEEEEEEKGPKERKRRKSSHENTLDYEGSSSRVDYTTISLPTSLLMVKVFNL